MKTFCMLLIALLVGLMIKATQARRCPTAGILAGYKGVLSSPYYPNEYPHRVDCDWIIMVPQGYHIKLVFTDFDIEYCVFCKCDYLEIRDGRNSTAPLLGKYCQKRKLSTIYSTGRFLWIKFYSDVGGRFQGFRAEYKAIKTGKTFDNIIHVSGNKGLVTNPKTIAACGTDRECTWLVRVRRPFQIKMQFSKIILPKCATPCGCNYIEIRDGVNASGRLIAKFCDSIQKPENICSSSNHLWMKYKYGLDLAHYGFRASYQKWQCRSQKVQQATIETEGTLDTVVGLICASFVFMAFMTLCMVCIASRKLSTCNRKTRNSTATPQIVTKAEHPDILPPQEFVPNPCSCHNHTHLHYTKDSETEYSEETEYGCDSGTEISVHYCRNCKIGPVKHPIAII